MTKEQLKAWYVSGLDKDATHMLVVGDINGFLTWPSYVYPEESVLSKINIYQKSASLVIFDIYTYERGFDEQYIHEVITKWQQLL